MINKSLSVGPISTHIINPSSLVFGEMIDSECVARSCPNPEGLKPDFKPWSNERHESAIPGQVPRLATSETKARTWSPPLLMVPLDRWFHPESGGKGIAKLRGY